MARLTLSLLGPFGLSLDGRPLPARLWAKTQALLAYLAVEAARPHAREALAGLLWPDDSNEAARHSLREALHQLRQALGDAAPGLLPLTPGTVALNRAELSLDVAQFGALIAECDAHSHRRLEACPSCVERLQQVVALYRGPFLAELSLRDSVPFEEWALVRREQLARLASAALGSLGEHYAVAGEHGHLEQVARRQIELDPYAEDAHRRLMCALYWGGRRNAALAHYEALRSTLAAELDAPPEEETTGLRARIEAAALPSRSVAPLRNWPAYPRLTSFHGRENELAGIAAHLGAADTHLLTLLGPGGVGKSRLALQAAEQQANSFQDGVCWVPLDTIDAAELVLPAIATALGVALPGSGEPLSRLCAWLQDREMLLVLDGCERCLEAGPLLASLAAACLQIRILATSREPLGVRGEHCFPVHPLPAPGPADALPEGAALSLLTASPAVALFADRARAVQPDLNLQADDTVAVAAICARLEGFPLSLELAAAQIGAFSPRALLERLSSPLTLLTGGPRDLPARQRTLRASIEWSYETLSPTEQALFRRLAAFTGGCTEAAAQALGTDAALPPLGSDAVQPVLATLCAKQLLQASEAGGERRLGMLETIREFGLACLEERGEHALTLRRHAEYYAAFKDRVMQELDRLEAEISNLRAAMRWSIASGCPEPGLRIACHNWFWSERNAEWRYWLDALLDLPGAQDPSVRVAPLFYACLQALFAGDDARFPARWAEHRALADALGDRNQQNGSLYLSGYLCLQRHDMPGAAGVFAAGLATAKQAGDPGWTAWFNSGLGLSLFLLHDLEGAEAALQAALAGFSAISFRFGQIETLTGLGYVALEDKAYAQAQERLLQALDEAAAMRFRSGQADALAGLAGLALRQGALARAARLYGATEQLQVQTGAQTHEPGLETANQEHLAELRRRLEPASLHRAWQEGRRLSPEEVLACARGDS